MVRTPNPRRPRPVGFHGFTSGPGLQGRRPGSMMRAMRYLHDKLGIVFRLGLLSLVLAAQSMAVAHELDHLGRADQPQCAVCSVSGSLSGPVHVEHEAWEPVPAVPQEINFTCELQSRRLESPALARAPPPLA